MSPASLASPGSQPCWHGWHTAHMARPPLYVIAGHELLVRRAAEQLVDELRAEGDIEVTDVRAPELGDDGLPDLRTGSLFGARRVVLVREAGELPAATAKALLADVEAAAFDATVILLATSTARIQKVARAAKELGGRIDVAPPPDFATRGWKDLIAAEFARHGRTASREALDAIVDHAGHDVDAIAEKVAQVCAATPTGSIAAEHVEHVVTGTGSQGSFAIADAMCERRPDEALALLRGALEAGDDPVMVLGALAYRVRAVVAVAGRIEPKAAGLSISPGQARHLERYRANFGPGELTLAYRTLAEADAALKGSDLPPALVIERAVVRIATPQAG